MEGPTVIYMFCPVNYFYLNQFFETFLMNNIKQFNDLKNNL